jgi:flagellar hook protein FlgE
MSFYTSLNGLKNAQTSLNVISHNIANGETNGFKKSRVEFSDIVAGTAYANPKLIQGVGATVEAIQQNFALGPIEQRPPRGAVRGRARTLLAMAERRRAAGPR